MTMIETRKYALTPTANHLADVHAFEMNLPEPKRCLEHDIDETLSPDEWQFVQDQYERVFVHIKKGMILYDNKTRRIERHS